MRLVGDERQRLLDESRLLDEVLDLVQVWEGSVPGPVLDAVLRGPVRVHVPLQRRGRAS